MHIANETIKLCERMKDLFGIHCGKPKFGDTIARLHRMTREESQVRNTSTRVIYFPLTAAADRSKTLIF